MFKPVFFPFDTDKEKLRQLMEKIQPVVEEDILAIVDSASEEFSVNRELLYILFYSLIVHLLVVNKIILKKKDK